MRGRDEDSLEDFFQTHLHHSNTHKFKLTGNSVGKRLGESVGLRDGENVGSISPSTLRKTLALSHTSLESQTSIWQLSRPSYPSSGV